MKKTDDLKRKEQKNKNKNKNPDCASCPYLPKDRLCKKADGLYPKSCPSFNYTSIKKEAQKQYAAPDNNEFARQACIQEGAGYADKELGFDFIRPAKPRIVEIAEFAQKMGYKKLGLIFCIGLRKEAKPVAKFFKDKKFEVTSVVCKVGAVPKEELGIKKCEKIEAHAFETMCNPIMQAQVCNEEKTEFNIILGLCVGHDSLVFKHSDAPCTVLAVKDRLLGHNPLAAVYTMDSYYRAITC